MLFASRGRLRNGAHAVQPHNAQHSAASLIFAPAQLHLAAFDRSIFPTRPRDSVAPTRSMLLAVCVEKRFELRLEHAFTSRNCFPLRVGGHIHLAHGIARTLPLACARTCNVYVAPLPYTMCIALTTWHFAHPRVQGYTTVLCTVLCPRWFADACI